MAEIKYRVCDRCKEKINPHHKTECKIYFHKRIRLVTRLFQYTSENSLELCGECTEGLNAYLYDRNKVE